MHNGLMVAYEKANEIEELLIRYTLYIQEDLNVTSLDLGYRLNVDLSGPDGERLYFKIEVRGLSHTSPPPSPWFEQKGKLLDREDPFAVVPLNGLWGHAIQ
jgi:hypothetical protein